MDKKPDELTLSRAFGKAREMVKEEPALITGLLFFFIVIKVLIVARGDVETAVGIFNTAGLATVIVGSLVSALPIISAGVAGLAAFSLSRNSQLVKAGPLKRRPAAVVWINAVLVTVALALALALTPWPIMVFSIILGIVSGLIMRMKKLQGEQVRPLTEFALLLASIVLVIGPLLYGVWLPHEKVTFADRGKPVVIGYVLSDSNGWVSILLSKQRRIERYRSMDISSRKPCHIYHSLSIIPFFLPGFFRNSDSVLATVSRNPARNLTIC